MQVKYDLGDWEKRKAGLLPILDAAATEGIVARDQLGKLADFLLGRGVLAGARPESVSVAGEPGGLDAPLAAEPVSAMEESESPRFIRGFHDILITIGVIIGLLGLGGLASVYAVIPAAIVLAEILVRRQRLALPAVVLTIALVTACGIGAYPLIDIGDSLTTDRLEFFILAAVTCAVCLLYFWRYKVPLALAVGLVTGLGTCVYALALFAELVSGNDMLFETHPVMASVYLGIFAALVFGTALKFDFADRLRLTRRSDVAFWMHLAAAPAILYTILLLVFLPGEGEWFSADTNLYQAAAIVVAVAALMLIGIILNRRAFVTSGLLSFGYAFKVLLTEGGVERFFSSGETLTFVILLAVGIVVLSLGIGWQPLRRAVVGNLPDAIRLVVPPVS